MPNELPTLPDIAALALAVGLLFCLRFVLAARRLAAERPGSSATLANGWGILRENDFGADREPERRHAARQLSIGIVSLGIALLLWGWLVVSSVLWPFIVQGRLASIGVGATS